MTELRHCLGQRMHTEALRFSVNILCVCMWVVMLLIIIPMQSHYRPLIPLQPHSPPNRLVHTYVIWSHGVVPATSLVLPCVALCWIFAIQHHVVLDQCVHQMFHLCSFVVAGEANFDQTHPSLHLCSCVHCLVVHGPGGGFLTHLFHVAVVPFRLSLTIFSLGTLQSLP